MSIRDEIQRLKSEKRAIILAHYYTNAEVQQVADFVGDSLALSQKAAVADADIILFAGVRFMAETAKVLSPSKKVLLPVSEAGCSLADSCDAEELRKARECHPDHLVVSYVNTSVEVKALTDICCTSSNALQIVESLPKEQPILFVPDRNL
ncbi:MAG: quinolinate synthase NadA, partial [Tidjanibacter sp.]|nr:quinolinate synthase NadA [Tidjanibacter sp.]